jgi:hypothetical protein
MISLRFEFSSLLAAVLSLTGAFAAAPALSLDGFGPFKFGMPTEHVRRIQQNEQSLQDGKPYNVAATDVTATNACQQFTLPQYKGSGLRFTAEKKKLVRIDVDFDSGTVETSAQTDKGIGLRSAEEDVLKAYPDAVIKRNPGDPTWHTIIVETPVTAAGSFSRPTARR